MVRLGDEMSESFDVGVAHRIGRYADAVRTPAGYDLVVTAGTPGRTEDGTLAMAP